MQLSWILTIAGYIGALGTITGAVAWVVKVALKDLYTQNRTQFRYNIVSFASDLHKGIPKTRDEYLSIFEQIDVYNDICTRYDIKNHLFEEETKFINKCFEDLDILKK